MKSLTYFVTAAFLLALHLNLCTSKAATSIMESQSHLRPKQYCEFYNSSMCIDSKSSEEGCNSRIDCSSDAKTHSCFVVWKMSPNGTINVMLKGCFTSADCNNTRCVDTNEQPKNDIFFCCCVGDMCNRDYTWEPKAPSPTTVPVEDSKPVPVPNASYYYLAIAILFFVVLMVIIVVLVYLRKNKNMFNEVPTSDPHPLTPPSPMMGLRPIELLEVKARGRFGAVYKAILKSEDIAVKVFPVQDKQSWLTEQEIFKLPNMNHANILQYIGVEKHGDNLQAEYWLITAYHERGSLCDFLKAHTLTWSELCRVVETMARGLMHLHEEIPGRHGEPGKPAIAHRDFKSKNVLLKSDMSACIADFGLALVFEMGKSCGHTHGQVGTRRYMAPEVLEGAINFTPDAFLRIDMYACGLVLWELVLRCTAQECLIPEYRLPFEEEVGQHPTLEDMQDAVVQRKVRPTIPESWRNHPGLVVMCETMEECWDHDAEARLSASCVMERVLNQSKYHHSSLSVRIENEAPRSPTKEQQNI